MRTRFPPLGKGATLILGLAFVPTCSDREPVSPQPGDDLPAPSLS